MKRFHFTTGIIISLFVALLAFIPRMVQDVAPDMLLALNLLIIFGYTLMCWFVNQYLLQKR